MATYLALFSLVGAGVVYAAVAFIKSKLPEQSVRFFVMFVSALVSVIVSAYAYRQVNVMSAGAITGVIYLFSQIYYELIGLFTKWLTQKQVLTKQEIVDDTEKAAEDIAKDVQQAEAAAPTA